MVRRIIDAMTDKVTADDRDFMGNKRLEPAGQQISLLFEDVFKNFNMKLRESAEHSLRGNTAAAFNITFHMKNSHLITHELKTVRALSPPLSCCMLHAMQRETHSPDAP